MEMGPGELLKGQSLGRGRPSASQGIDAVQAGREAGGAGVRLAAPMETLCPQREKRGRILCFQITAGRVPVPLLLLGGTPDKEKALAEFNLIWALGAYQVILFPSRRVLLLPCP